MVLALINLPSAWSQEGISLSSVNKIALGLLQPASDADMTKVGTALGPHYACMNAGRINGMLQAIPYDNGKGDDNVSQQVAKVRYLSDRMTMLCTNASPYMSLNKQMEKFHKEVVSLLDLTKNENSLTQQSDTACEKKLQLARDELAQLSSKPFTGAQKAGIRRIISAISENKAPPAQRAK